MSERWDIYWRGKYGAKELMGNMLKAWTYLLPAGGEFGEAFVAAVRAFCLVLWIIVCPLFFWIAPIIAIFTAHRIVSDEEMSARLRAGIHKNGPI